MPHSNPERFSTLLTQLHEWYRYPKKTERLTRVMVAFRHLCEDDPTVVDTPVFIAAATDLVQQMLQEARDAPYPLTSDEAIEAILIGAQTSNLVPIDKVLELQARIRRGVARALPNG